MIDSITCNYLVHTCIARVKQCLCVCLSVCLSAKQNAPSSWLAKAFTYVILSASKHCLYWGVSVPDTSQGGSFHLYFSYFLLSVSRLHPFQIACGSKHVTMHSSCCSQVSHRTQQAPGMCPPDTSNSSGISKDRWPSHHGMHPEGISQGSLNPISFLLDLMTLGTNDRLIAVVTLDTLSL